MIIIVLRKSTTRSSMTFKLFHKIIITSTVLLAVNGDQFNGLSKTSTKPIMDKQIAEEELFFAKQITDFIEEKNYKIAEDRSLIFLKKFPQSTFRDNILSILADIQVQKKKYLQAIQYYQKIGDLDLFKKNICNYLFCLEQAGRYTQLIDICQKNESLSKLTKYYRVLGYYHLAETGDKKALQQAIKLAQNLEFNDELEINIALLKARLYTLNNEALKACRIYELLAKKTADDYYQLQAAILQLSIDPKKACDQLQALSKNSSVAELASIYYIKALFALKDFKTIIDNAELVSAESRPKVLFFIGQSYYFLKDFKNSYNCFKRLIKTPYVDAEALVMALKAALQLKKEADAKILLQQLKKSFQGPVLADAYESLATFYCNKGDLCLAKQYLKKIEKMFPNNETAIHNLGIIFFRLNEFDRAKEYIDRYLTITKNPDPAIYKTLLQVTIKLSKNSTDLLPKIKKLVNLPLLSDDDRDEMTFILIKKLVECDKTAEALRYLQKIKKDFDGEYIQCLALCYYKQNRWDKVIECFAKKSALPSDALPILFNSFLHEKRYDEASKCIATMILQKSDVSPENLTWYIEYTLKKLSSETITADEKRDLHSILQKAQDGSLEKKWQLMKVLNATNSSLMVLKIGDSIKKDSSELGIKVSLELAKAYYSQKDYEKAIAAIYDIVLKDPLIKTRSIAEIYFTFCKSVLQLPKKHQTEYKTALLTSLKKLTTQRNFSFEPLHLEAAFLYVDSLYPKISEKRRQLLLKLKKDFCSKTDILSQDYHKAKEQSPALFDAFMEKFDYQINLCDHNGKTTKINSAKKAH